MDAPTSTGIPTQPAPLKPWKQVAEESNIFSLPPEQRLAEYDKWSAENVAQGIRDGDFDSPDTFSQFKLFDIRTRKNLASDDIIGPSDDDIATEYDLFTKSFQDTQRAFAADKPTPQDEAIQGEVLQGKRKSAFVRGQMVFNPAVVNDPQKYREAILESDAPSDIKMFYAGLRPEMEKSATVTRRRELANNVITRDVADKVVTAIQEGTELFGADIGTPQSPALKKNKDGIWSVVDPEYSDKETSFLGRANAKYNPLADSLYKPFAAINEYQQKYGLTDEQVQQDYMESLIENAPTSVNRWFGKATSIEEYVKQLDSTVRVKNKDVAPEVRVQDPNLFFDAEGYNAAVDKAKAPDEAKTFAKEARTQFADAVAGDIYNNLLNNRDDFREGYAKDVVDRKDMEKAITRYYKDKKDQAWYDDVGETIGQAGTALKQGGMDLMMMPSAIKGMFGDVEAAENYRYYTLAQKGEMQAEEAVANRTGGAGFIKLNNDVMRIIPDLVVQMVIAVATGGMLSGAQASLIAARTGISRAAATTALRQAAITGEKTALKSQLLRLIPEVTAKTVDDVAEEVLKASARTVSNNPFKGGIGTQRAVGSAYAGLSSASATFGQVYTDVRNMGKSPEESIATARTAGIVAGAITSGLTHSFGMLGRGGVEDFASMGRKAGEFTIKDIVNAGMLDSLKTPEGRQLIRNIAKGISKDALSEGAEEGLDQALNLISQYATNPSPEAQNRKATDIINESLYASLLGGIAGSGAASVGQARASAPGITAQQIQAEILGAQQPPVAGVPPVQPQQPPVQAPPVVPVAPVVPSANPAVQNAQAVANAAAAIPNTSQTTAALTALANAVSFPMPEKNLPEIETPAEPVPEVQPAANQGPVAAPNQPVVPVASAAATTAFASRNTDMLPDKEDFGGKFDKPLLINPDSYSNKDGIESVEYSNPDTGVVDVYISAFGNNDFIAYMRVYDANGNPTNRFTSKLERRTNRLGATRAMIEELQSRLPKDHQYSEDTSVSTDGLRFFTNQLQQGYSVATNPDGTPITTEVAISGESISNDLPVPVDPNGKFENIRISTSSDFAKVKEYIGKKLEAFNVGLNASNVRWENGTAYIDLPVLQRQPAVAQAQQSAAQAPTPEVAPANTEETTIEPTSEPAKVEQEPTENMKTAQQIPKEGRFSIYQSGGRWLVQQGEKRGVGDYIFSSQADAEAEAARAIDMEQKNAEFSAKQEANDAAEKSAQEEKEKPLNEYLDSIGATPMQRGKLKASLKEYASRKSVSTGKTYQGERIKVVRDMVNDGYSAKAEQVDAIQPLSGSRMNIIDNRQQAEFEKRRAAAGKKTQYMLSTSNGGSFVVTKSEYDYAKWIEQKTTPPTKPEAPARDTTKPEQMTPEEAVKQEFDSRWSGKKVEEYSTWLEKNPKPNRVLKEEGVTKAQQSERFAKWIKKLTGTLWFNVAKQRAIPNSWVSDVPTKEFMLASKYMKQGDMWVAGPNSKPAKPSSWDTQDYEAALEAVEEDRASAQSSSESFNTYLQSIEKAISENRPVSVAAMEYAQYKTIPDGYVKQGELYVYQPEQKAEAAVEVSDTQVIPEKTLKEISAYPDFSDRVTGGNMLDATDVSRYLAFRESTTSIPKADVAKAKKDLKNPTVSEIEAALSKYAEERNRKTQEGKDISAALKRAGESDELDVAISNYNQAKSNLDAARIKRNNPIAGVQWEAKLLSSQVGDAQKKLSDAGKKLIAIAGKAKQPKPTKQDAVQEPSPDASVLRQEGQEVGLSEVDQGGRGAEQKAAGKEREVKTELTEGDKKAYAGLEVDSLGSVVARKKRSEIDEWLQSQGVPESQINPASGDAGVGQVSVKEGTQNRQFSWSKASNVGGDSRLVFRLGDNRLVVWMAETGAVHEVSPENVEFYEAQKTKPELTPEQNDVVVFVDIENDTQEKAVVAAEKKPRMTPGKARKKGIATQIDSLGIKSNDSESVIAALEKIANNPKPKPSEKHHIRIAKDLLSVLKDSGVKIQLVSGNDARMAKHDSSVNGWYDPKTNTAYINLDGPHELGIQETILHELVHASGEKVIQNPQTEQQKSILTDLEKQMLAARKNAIALGKAKLGTDVTELNMLIDMAASQNDYGLFDILYGVSSLSEYHAHATTSRSFQKFLATYKEGGKRSLMERFINGITSLLSGKKTADGSDAEKAYATLLDLMREGKGDVRLSNADVVQSRARGASTEQDAEYLELAKDEEKNAEALQAIVDEAAKAAGGKPVFRYVSRDGMGMLNSEAYNIDKLNDDDASDLEDWLNYGLQQPRDVASDQVFYFNEEGKSINKDGLRLLKKAARRGFVEETRFAFGNPSWETDDGQIAVSPNQIKSADPVTRDDAGNVIPLSQRFQPTSPDIRFSRARGTASDEDARHAALEARAKDGDAEATAEAQAIVNEAADDAAYKRSGYHGTRASWTVWDSDIAGGLINIGESKEVAERYATGAGGGRQPLNITEVEYYDGRKFTQQSYTEWTSGSESLSTEQIQKDVDDGDAVPTIPGASVKSLRFKADKILDLTTPEGIKVLAGLNYTTRLGQGVVSDAKAGKFYWDRTKNEYALKTWKNELIPQLKELGYDSVRFKDDTHNTIAVFSPEQIKSADPFTYDEAGNLIPLSQRFQPESPDIRFSRARGRFDLVDAVRAASSGDASTPFQALNEAINANTELTRRIQAGSERRSRAYARGKGAILEQIIRAGNTGRLPEEAIKPITDFVNSVSPQALADTRISLSAKPQNSTFDFVDSLVTLALNGMGSEPGEIDRTAIHEFWHGLSRFIPDDEIEKIRKDYVAAVKEYISENPWFVPFIGRTHLSEAQYDDLSRMLSKEEMDAIPWKNWETLEDGRRIRGLKWTKENYRLFRLDEWVAETMADLVRRKQERPTTFLGKMARLFRDFIDTLKQALGNPYLKALDAMTVPDEAFDAQIERFGPIEDNPPVMYGSEGVGMNNQFVESKARGIVSDTVTKFAPEFNVIDDKDGPAVFFDGRNVAVNPDALENLDEYEVKDLSERAVVSAKAAPKDPIAASIIQQTDGYSAYNFDSVSRKEIRKSLAKAHAVATENGMAPLAMDLGSKLFEYGGATDAEVRKSMARGVEDQMAVSDITNVPSEYSKQLAIKRAALAEKVAPGDDVVAEIISISGKYDNFNFDTGTKRSILESLSKAYDLSDEFGLSEYKPYIKSWIIQNEGVLAPGASRHSTKKRTPGEENAEFEKYLEKVATSDPDPEERKWAKETAQSFADISANYYGYTKERWHGTRNHWTVWDAAIAGGVINTALDEEVGRSYGLAGGGSRADYPIEDTMFGTDDSEYEYSDGVFKRISGDYGPKKLTIPQAQKLADKWEGDFYPKSFQNKRLYVKADNMLDLYTRKDELALLEILQTIEFSNAEFYQKTQFQQVLSEASKKPHPLSPNEAAGRYWPTTTNEARFGAWRDLIIPALKKAGYDGIRLRDDSHTTEAVFDAEQIKSAEPFTYDDNGDLIPSAQRFNAAIPDIRYSRARGVDLVAYVPRNRSGPRLAVEKFFAGFRSRGMVTEDAYNAFRDFEAFKKETESFIAFIAKDFTNVTNKLFGDGADNWLNYRIFSRDASGNVTVSKTGFKTAKDADNFATTNRYKDYIVSTGEELMNKALGSNGPTLREDVRDRIDQLTKKGLDDIAKSIEAYKDEYLRYWNLVMMQPQPGMIDPDQIATLRERKEQWMKALQLRAAEQRQLVDDARKEAVRVALEDGANHIIAQQKFAKTYLPDELVYQIERTRDKIDEFSTRLTKIGWLMEGSELQMVIDGRMGVYVTRSYEAFETQDRANYVAFLDEAYRALYNPEQEYNKLAMERIMPMVRHIKDGITERRIQDLKKENEQRQLDEIMADLMADPRQVTQVDRIPGQPIEGTEYEQLLRAVAKRELLLRRLKEKDDFIAKAVASLGKSTFASNIGNARNRMRAIKKEAKRLYRERFAEQVEVANIMGAPNALRWTLMTEDEAHDIANVERSLSESPSNIAGSEIWTASISGRKHSTFHAAVSDDFRSNLDTITNSTASQTGFKGTGASDWRSINDKILEYKENVPAFRRLFLGEINNPLMRVSETLTKQASLIAAGELYANLADIGTRQGWLVQKDLAATDTTKYAGWTSILTSSDNDQGYKDNPLKNLVADPVMVEAIRKLLSTNQPSNSAFKAISFAVGWVLFNLTAGSFKSIQRNLSSFIPFLLNTGLLGAIIDPRRWSVVTSNFVLASKMVEQSMASSAGVSSGKDISNPILKRLDKGVRIFLSGIAALRLSGLAVKGVSTSAGFVFRTKQKPTKEQFQGTYQRAVSLGVANDNVDKEAMSKMLNLEETLNRKPKDKKLGKLGKVLMLNEASEFGSYAFSLAKSTLKERSQLYGAPDDFTKIFAWLNEMDAQARIHAKDTAEYEKWRGKDGLFSDMPPEHVELAAEYTTDLVQSHSKVWAHITQFKKAGFGVLAAAFIAAKAEFYRNAFNSYRIAVKEMRSKNERERNAGIARFASALTAHFVYGNAIGYGLKMILKAFADDDEVVEDSIEIRNAISALGPEYAKNKNATYVVYKNGTFDWVDLSFSTPFAFVWETINAGKRGVSEAQVEDNIVWEMTKEIVGENLGNFASPQIALDAFAVMRTGFDPIRGVKIWDSQTDNMGEKLMKSMGYFLKKVGSPGDVKSVSNIVNAARGIEENGRQYKLGTEVGSVFLGTSVRTFKIADIVEQKLAQGTNSLNNRITPLYNSVLTESNDVSMDDCESDTTEYYKTDVEVMTKMQKIWAAGNTLLADTPGGKKMLRAVIGGDKVKMESNRERALTTGKRHRVTLSDSMDRKVKGLGDKYDDPRYKVVKDTLKKLNEKP